MSSYPSTLYLGYYRPKSTSGVNALSIVNLNASSSILGINYFNKFELSSKHGFAFTSINHILKLSSIIKSNPNNYIPYFLFLLFILAETKVVLTLSFIIGQPVYKKS